MLWKLKTTLRKGSVLAHENNYRPFMQKLKSQLHSNQSGGCSLSEETKTEKYRKIIENYILKIITSGSKAVVSAKKSKQMYRTGSFHSIYILEAFGETELNNFWENDRFCWHFQCLSKKYFSKIKKPPWYSKLKTRGKLSLHTTEGTVFSTTDCFHRKLTAI